MLRKLLLPGMLWCWDAGTWAFCWLGTAKQFPTQWLYIYDSSYICHRCLGYRASAPLPSTSRSSIIISIQLAARLCQFARLQAFTWNYYPLADSVGRCVCLSVSLSLSLFVSQPVLAVYYMAWLRMRMRMQSPYAINCRLVTTFPLQIC